MKKVNVDEYRKRRAMARTTEPVYRRLCSACLQPDFSCYCARVKPFDPGFDTLILIHPIEVKRRRIATGRMAHLSLHHSHLIMGVDFTHDARLNALLARDDVHTVMLYPGANSMNLTFASPSERRALVPPGKRLALVVMDGTWATARKMVRSENLRGLPRVCFTPEAPSNFRVRRQPKRECVSTLEAIHHTIDLLGTSVDHGSLLETFDWMVNRQLELAHSVWR